MKKILILIGLLTALYACEKDEEIQLYQDHEFYIKVENTFPNHGLNFDWAFKGYSGNRETRYYYDDTYAVLSSGDSIYIEAYSNSTEDITITVQDERRNMVFEVTGKQTCVLLDVIP